MSTLSLNRDVVTSTPIEDLSVVERNELFALLSLHFDGVTPDQFARDLAEKQWALRLRREDRLVGFSTLRVYPKETRWGRIHVFYSGDTIVAPEAWDSSLLARGWIGLVQRIQATLDPHPCYWLLLSSGFRTYRFLPVFWRTFWPQANEPTPAKEREMMDGLARDHFGDAYDSDAGIVRFARPQKLKARLATIPEGRAQNRHIAFFCEKNSGHADGDELVCLTELSEANLTRAGERMVRGAQ